MDDDKPPSPDGAPRRRRLAASDSAAMTRPRAEPEPEPEPEAAGLLAGRYRMEGPLGRGGMGVVYRAFDQELSLPVALKLLPPELAGNKRSIEDLKREALLAMKLRHPAICALYNFATDGDRKFLVMELLEGQTLAARLDEADTLPVPEVLALARALAPALDYAHAERVVHRDLKPDNIFLARRGDAIQPCLTDFGIARQMKEALSRVTQQDSSGTLLYMSPEQLRGKAVDGRADVYSLAATLYECLAGHPPFFRGAIAEQITSEPPEPLPDVPDAVNRALLRALAKRPEERFATCADFVAALEGTATTAATAATAAAAAAASSPIPSSPSSPQPLLARLVSACIDSFLLLVIAWVVQTPIWLLFGDELGTMSAFLLLALLTLVRDLVPAGGSLGKRALGARIEGLDGRPASSFRTVVRNLPLAAALLAVAATVPLDAVLPKGDEASVGLATLIGLFLLTVLAVTFVTEGMLPLFTAGHRRLGDYLAGTRVVLHR